MLIKNRLTFLIPKPLWLWVKWLTQLHKGRPNLRLSQLMLNMLKDVGKRILFRHTRLGAPRYDYNISPRQCAAIINGLEDLRHGDGAIVEVGVARGMTSRFIAEYLRSVNSNVPFYCIDTFASFTPEDVRVEVERRGKTRAEISGFGYNDFNRWKANFADFDFVTAIKADANDFDFGSIAPIKFMFVDCDLYRPTLNILRNAAPYLASDFIILVDDVMDNSRWDGAFEAFHEFASETNFSTEVIAGNCGVVRPA